jgi:hypothetical protein
VDAGAKPLTFAEVRAARERGHEYLLQTVAIILGTYHDDQDSEHVRKRNELMKPIDKMAGIVRAVARARRNGTPLPELPPNIADEGADALDPVNPGDGIG